MALGSTLIIKGDCSSIFGDGKMDERRESYQVMPLQLIGAAP
jgi:hypothetical protein